METRDLFLERPWLRRLVVRLVGRAVLTALALATAGLLWLVLRAGVQGRAVAAIRESGARPTTTGR